MASSDTNHSSPVDSTPLADRMQNFEKLNLKGKITVSAVVVCGLAAVSFVGVRLVRGLHGGVKKIVAKKKENDESDGNFVAYDVVAKGFTTVQANLGPWSFQDLTIGLAAISKVTEKRPPHPPGHPAKELAQNASFLARTQHWRALAEAAYTSDPASFSLYSQLPESVIVAAEWNPCQETLRPAFVICIDAPYGAIVLTVRGTSQVVDMLVNSGTSAEPFLDGHAHGGFVNATEHLVEQVLPHIKRAFEDQLKCQKDLKLVITGHSMGAAVGIMAGLKLRQSSEFTNIECWGFSTPASVTLDVAGSCKDFVTSVVALHDVVPRFSIDAVETLRKRICDFDWEDADRIVHGDDDWGNIKSAAEKLKSAQVTQKEVSKSVQQAMDGFGEKAKDVAGKIGGPFCDNNDKDSGKDGQTEEGKEETKEEIEEKEEEEKKEHPPFYVPGRLLVLAADPPGCGKAPENRSDVPRTRDSGTYPTFDEAKKVTWVMHETEPEDLKEIVISPWCVSDHMLGYLGEGLGYLQRHCEPAFGGPPPM